MIKMRVSRGIFDEYACVRKGDRNSSAVCIIGVETVVGWVWSELRGMISTGYKRFRGFGGVNADHVLLV